MAQKPGLSDKVVWTCAPSSPLTLDEQVGDAPSIGELLWGQVCTFRTQRYVRACELGHISTWCGSPAGTRQEWIRP